MLSQTNSASMDKIGESGAPAENRTRTYGSGDPRDIPFTTGAPFFSNTGGVGSQCEIREWIMENDKWKIKNRGLEIEDGGLT